MAFIRTKEVNGQKYYYLVANKRVKGRVVQKVLKYIGKPENILTLYEEKDVKSREKKLVNHLKWTARKNNCTKVILHSFAHLSESKASIEFTKELFDLAEKRLQNAEFTTAQTPFGYFLDLKLKAPGYSLARIWATL